MSFSQPQPAPPYGPAPGPPQGQGPYGGGMPQGWLPAAPPAQRPPQPAQQEHKGDTEALALMALLMVFHVLVNLYWLNADNHLALLDEAHFLKQSALWCDALFPAESVGLFSRVVEAMAIESPYPPLAYVVGAVFMHVFGYSPDTIALSGSAALLLLLLGVYMLARQGMTARNAFLVALVLSFTPMVYGFSRLAMTDNLHTAIVVWAMYALLKSDRFQKPGWVVTFGVLGGLAMLTRPIAFVYLATPALGAVCLGVTAAFIARNPEKPAVWRRQAANTLLRALMCVCIVAGVGSWWYLRHIEYTHAWWTTQRGGVYGLLQPALAARIPGAADAPTTPLIHLDPALTSTMVVSDANASQGGMSLFEPIQHYWKTYPLYLVNEALFLPPAALAALGVLALLCKRNRTALSLLLLFWVIGGWMLLTGMFALHSPRFLHPLLPALAFFPVMALDAIPKARLRRAAWGAFALVLFVTFINLSIHHLGPIKRLELPLLAEEEAVRARGNDGLTLLKHVVHAGHYTLHAPMRGKTVTEAALEAMVVRERNRHAPEGPAAWYQVVSPAPSRLSIDLYARHYAAPPNTMRPAGLDDALSTDRAFAAVKGEVERPEDTLPELAETEYVILKQPVEGDYVAALEQAVTFFKQHGFESLLHRFFPGYGPTAPGYVHVLAQQEVPLPGEVRDVFELYDLLERDGRDWLLSDEDRMEAEQRYAAQVRQYTDARPLTDTVNFLGFHVAATAAEDWHIIRLVIHVAEPVRKELRVWLRAVVHNEDRAHLLDTHQRHPQLQWDFDPQPSATHWQRNQALVLSRPVMAKSLRYRFEIGLFAPDTEAAPATTVETEWVIFPPGQ